MKEDNSKLLEIFHLTWPNLTKNTKVIDKMNQIQKLNMIEYADYYSVYDRNGKKICDSPSIQDTLMMVNIGEGRTYRKIKILLDQVVNVSSMKMADPKQLQEQKVLPDRTAEPVIV
jgi:hypothetical protein